MNDFNHIISHHNSPLRTHIARMAVRSTHPFQLFISGRCCCGSDVDEGAIIDGNHLTKKAISFLY